MAPVSMDLLVLHDLPPTLHRPAFFVQDLSRPIGPRLHQSVLVAIHRPLLSAHTPTPLRLPLRTRRVSRLACPDRSSTSSIIQSVQKGGA
jgi:hypothetical protein